MVRKYHFRGRTNRNQQEKKNLGNRIPMRFPRLRNCLYHTKKISKAVLKAKNPVFMRVCATLGFRFLEAYKKDGSFHSRSVPIIAQKVLLAYMAYKANSSHRPPFFACSP